MKRVANQARLLAMLMDDPQPGLMTWNIAVERAYQDLKDAITHEQARRAREQKSKE